MRACCPLFATRSRLSQISCPFIAGEGIPDLLLLLVQLTQQRMASRLTYLDKLQCTVLEVRLELRPLHAASRFSLCSLVRR